MRTLSIIFLYFGHPQLPRSFLGPLSESWLEAEFAYGYMLCEKKLPKLNGREIRSVCAKDSVVFVFQPF